MLDQKKLGLNCFAWIVFFVLSNGMTVAEAKFLPLNPAGLIEAKTKPCTLVHAWAVWCSLCVQEMPELVKFFNENPQIKPVVVDVSGISAQNDFTKKWKILKSAKFDLFLKPSGDDDAYMAAIDAKWSGTLPYSALYHKGKKIKEWEGVSPTQEWAKTFPALCK